MTNSLDAPETSNKMDQNIYQCPEGILWYDFQEEEDTFSRKLESLLSSFGRQPH